MTEKYKELRALAEFLLPRGSVSIELVQLLAEYDSLANPLTEEQEHEAFEEWKANYSEYPNAVHRFLNGDYVSSRTDDEWQVWLARARLAAKGVRDER